MLSNKLSIIDIPEKLENKRVLIRVDFNVPLKDGVIQDATRIKATIPTIQYILEKKPKSIVLMSHCGRPDGQKKPEYSLKPCALELEKLLNKKVHFLPDCVGKEVEDACMAPSQQGSIFLLENLRYHIEEEGKGVSESGEKIKASKEAVEQFKTNLSKLGDVFINDAFGTAHRAHASMVGVSHEIRAAGFLLKKELDYFGKALESPQRPVLAILGGAKVKDKILLIENMLEKVDRMIIGGGMAYTFLKVLDNMPIGQSLYDEEGAKRIHAIMEKAKKHNVKMLFPVDFLIANEFSEKPSVVRTVTKEEGIPDDFQGLDSATKTSELIKPFILESKTIIWNGPQGKFEWALFRKGSMNCLNYVVEATKQGALSIVGGGDTAALVEQEGMTSQLSHVSTGGGASLELLEGKQLPGVVYLSNKS